MLKIKHFYRIFHFKNHQHQLLSLHTLYGKCLHCVALFDIFYYNDCVSNRCKICTTIKSRSNANKQADTFFENEFTELYGNAVCVCVCVNKI